jgi:hypothetical protein
MTAFILRARRFLHRIDPTTILTEDTFVNVDVHWGAVE